MKPQTTMGLTEAATHCGLSSVTINRYRKKGALRAKKGARGFRFKIKDLEKLMQTVQPRKKSKKAKKSRKKTATRRASAKRMANGKAVAKAGNADVQWLLRFRGYMTADMTESFLIWASSLKNDGGGHRIGTAGELSLAWTTWMAAEDARS